MKILQIFGWVVAIHLLAFFGIFASPGCSSSPRNVPTPDATVPSAAGAGPDQSYSSVAAAPIAPFYPTDATPGRATPTRPGSPNAAAITPAKNAAANVSPVTSYTIQKGDSLWTIAKKNHITVSELSKANNLTGSSSLKPGKKLMIPGKPIPVGAPADNSLSLSLPATTAAAPAPAEAPVRTSTEIVKHVVANGESLGTIARKYQVKVGDLAAANNITDPAKIRVGQPLVIPGGKSAAAKSAVKSTAKTVAPVAKSTASTPAAKPTSVTAPHAEPSAVEAAAQFEIKPPPPGQDLDSGLSGGASTDVPTIKVEEPKSEEAPK